MPLGPRGALHLARHALPQQANLPPVRREHGEARGRLGVAHAQQRQCIDAADLGGGEIASRTRASKSVSHLMRRRKLYPTAARMALLASPWRPAR
jgi:hypothetical protein